MNASPEMAARDRRRVVRSLAPLVGLLAVGLLAWQGSYSAFSATTDNGTEQWTTGSTMVLTNNGGNLGAASYLASTTAIFNESTFKPGDTVSKCLTVKSGSSYGGSLRFWHGTVADSTPSLGAQISIKIDASVVTSATDVQSNCTAFPASPTNPGIVPLTPLSTLPGTSWGTAAASSVTIGAGNGTPVYVAYKISYTFASTADNTFLGKTVSAPFTWELQ